MGGELGWISANTVTATAYGTLMVAIVTFLLRIGCRILLSAKFQTEDVCVIASIGSFVSLATLTIVVTPAMYRVLSVTSGQSPSYPTFIEDAVFELQVSFANALLFCITLWAVKYSFLFLYRRLPIGSTRQPIYERWWWAIVIFTTLSLVGCIITILTRCSTLPNYFTPGGCSSDRDKMAQAVSLYFSFAVDVITDIMIMLWALWIIWSLRLASKKKLSVGCLICLVLICVFVAVARLTIVSPKPSDGSAPTLPALAIWGLIEPVIAVVIGCVPAFYGLYNRHQTIIKDFHLPTLRRGQEVQPRPSSRLSSATSTNLSRSQSNAVVSVGTSTRFSRLGEGIIKTVEIDIGYGDYGDILNASLEPLDHTELP